ncbi:MAG: hypothetical protein LC770_13550, partial [Acidobacteria bacterium]|nr:hypothetical protein [Acidobacteriota bacterium]
LGPPVTVIGGPGACVNKGDWGAPKLASPVLQDRKKTERRVANRVKTDGITIEWFKIPPFLEPSVEWTGSIIRRLEA